MLYTLESLNSKSNSLLTSNQVYFRKFDKKLKICFMKVFLIDNAPMINDYYSKTTGTKTISMNIFI